MKAAIKRVQNAAWWRVCRAVSRPKGVNIALITHHKTGTVLAKNIANIAQLGQGTVLLSPEKTPADAEQLRLPNEGVNRIALYPHGHLDPADLVRFHRVYHFVRDPASLAISSAIYHKKGREAWLHEEPNGPILSKGPNIASYRPRHASEQPDFIAQQLQGQSYYQRVASMDLPEAIAFELNMCAAWNIRDMQALPTNENTVKVDIHNGEFAFMPFWQSVMEELEGQTWARSMLMKQVSKWDRAKASSWSSGARAHLSDVSDYDKHWTSEHQALLEANGLA